MGFPGITWLFCTERQAAAADLCPEIHENQSPCRSEQLHADRNNSSLGFGDSLFAIQTLSHRLSVAPPHHFRYSSAQIEWGSKLIDAIMLITTQALKAITAGPT